MNQIVKEQQEYDFNVALPYQLRWVEDQRKVKICAKSRRTGLTWIEAGDSVLLAATDRTEGGMDVYYISTRKELAQEFIDTAAQWAQALLGYAIPIEEGFIGDPKDDILSYYIRFVSGFRIVALSSKPSNMRGLQGRIIIDEAAYHDDLPALLKAAYACTMWRGQIRIISTHHGEDNPFNLLIRKFESGDFPVDSVSYHKITIDQALKEGLYKRICHVNGLTWSEEKQQEYLTELLSLYGDDALEELYCEPNTGTGAYFSRDMVAAASSDDHSVLRYALPTAFVNLPKYQQTEQVAIWLDTYVKGFVTKLVELNYKTYAGLDFGRTHDLTVLSILVEDWNKKRWVPFMLELRNVPFHCQEQICTYILKGVKKFRKAAFDSTGNGSFLGEAMALEFGSARIDQVKMTQEYYLQHFPRYKAALENKKLEIPYDEDILSDHRSVQLVNGVPKVPTNVENKGADGKSRHGDAAISLMLAYAAVPEDKDFKHKIPPAFARSGSYYDFS